MRLLKFKFIFFFITAFQGTLLAQTSEHVLAAEEVIKLIPDRIKGFEQLIDPKASQTKIGSLTYALCEKSFSKGRKSIKILLFDYKEAPIMYTQAMREWGNRISIESDTLVFRSIVMENSTGWESYHRINRTSQIFLGICDRFFLMMTGQNVELELLKKALLEIRVEKFPN